MNDENPTQSVVPYSPSPDHPEITPESISRAVSDFCAKQTPHKVKELLEQLTRDYKVPRLSLYYQDAAGYGFHWSWDGKGPVKVEECNADFAI